MHATGLALNDSALMLAGAVPAAGLALISELVFELWERAVPQAAAALASQAFGSGLKKSPIRRHQSQCGQVWV